jgi:hypothetical protein
VFIYKQDFILLIISKKCDVSFAVQYVIKAVCTLLSRLHFSLMSYFESVKDFCQMDTAYIDRDISTNLLSNCSNCFTNSIKDNLETLLVVIKYGFTISNQEEKLETKLLIKNGRLPVVACLFVVCIHLSNFSAILLLNL